MPAAISNEITALLRAWSQGDRTALDCLIPIVDRELRSVARRCLESRRDSTVLDTTELVNEAYMRLIDRKRAEWHDRVHFFAVSARIMRHILVDHARARHTAKRGGATHSIPLDEAAVPDPGGGPWDLIAVDQALSALAKFDQRKEQVVELRFFGGLTIEETADVLNVSPETVRRDWRLARAWLVRELGSPDGR